MGFPGFWQHGSAWVLRDLLGLLAFILLFFLAPWCGVGKNTAVVSFFLCFLIKFQSLVFIGHYLQLFAVIMYQFGH